MLIDANNQPALGTAERSLYAALISDLPTLLPACTSWEDHLWAHIQSRMESRLEQRWNNLGGFWQKEETLVGQDDGEELLGSLDEVFVNIAQTGSVEARFVYTIRYPGFADQQDAGKRRIRCGATHDHSGPKRGLVQSNRGQHTSHATVHVVSVGSSP